MKNKERYERKVKSAKNQIKEQNNEYQKQMNIEPPGSHGAHGPPHRAPGAQYGLVFGIFCLFCFGLS